MKYIFYFSLLSLFFACNSPTGKSTNSAPKSPSITADTPKLNAAKISAKREIPVLCYHQIRAFRAGDSKRSQDLIITPSNFEAHIKMLADSGYHSIQPDDLYAYLSQGKVLPSRSMMITFDDNDENQYTIAKPILDKYGFKAVYFIMTVTIGHPRYMNKIQIKALADAGNTIASHTYDHLNFNKFKPEDWDTQIAKPLQVLENIIGKKITYFAFPYGLWNKENLPKLKDYGFKAAFILSTSQDADMPLYTIRRIIDPQYYTALNLLHSMQKSFNKPALK